MSMIYNNVLHRVRISDSVALLMEHKYNIEYCSSSEITYIVLRRLVVCNVITNSVIFQIL